MQLYGNALWNEHTDNSNKSVILAKKDDFEHIKKALESVAMNYCAFFYKQEVHIAIEKSDFQNFQRLDLQYDSVSNSKVKNKSVSNIIGNTAYSDIENKRYNSMSTSLALNIAKQLDDLQIRYSGRIQGNKATLTVDASDYDFVRSIINNTNKVHSVFDRQENLTVSINAEILPNDVDFLNISKDDYLNSNVFKSYEHNAFTFSDITTITATTEVMTEIRSAMEEEKEQVKNDENSQRFTDSLRTINIRTSALNSIIPASKLLYDRLDDDDLIFAFENTFKDTSFYSDEQYSRLSELFVNTYQSLHNTMCLLANTEEIENFKTYANNQKVLNDVTEGKGFTEQQIEVISKMVDRKMSKTVLELLDYTFSVEQLEKFEKARSSYYDLVAVIAEVKNTSVQHIMIQLDNGFYIPALPDLENNEKTFAQQVDIALSSDNKNQFNALKVCDTPQILLDVGCKQLPMLYTQKHLKNSIHPKSEKNSHWHGLSVEQIKQLPELIKNPAMVFDSVSRNDSICIVSNAVDNNKSALLITIKPNGKGIYELESIDSNFITSVYGKDNFSSYIEKIVNAGNLLFCDKEKSQELFRVSGLQSPKCLNNLDYDIIIHKSNNIVNTEQEEKVPTKNTVDEPKEENTNNANIVSDDKSAEGTFEIYQMKEDEKYHFLRFASYKEFERQNVTPNIADYNLVYSGNLADIPYENKLEGIYTIFNTNHPDGYTGKSVSVSDVIVTNIDNNKTANFVDRVGYKDVTNLFVEKTNLISEHFSKDNNLGDFLCRQFSSDEIIDVAYALGISNNSWFKDQHPRDTHENVAKRELFTHQFAMRIEDENINTYIQISLNDTGIVFTSNEATFKGQQYSCSWKEAGESLYLAVLEYTLDDMYAEIIAQAHDGKAPIIKVEIDNTTQKTNAYPIYNAFQTDISNLYVIYDKQQEKYNLIGDVKQGLNVVNEGILYTTTNAKDMVDYLKKHKYVLKGFGLNTDVLLDVEPTQEPKQIEQTDNNSNVLEENNAEKTTSKSVDELKVGDTIRLDGEEWTISMINEDFSVVLKNTDKNSLLSEQSFFGNWKEKISEIGFEYVEPTQSIIEEKAPEQIRPTITCEWSEHSVFEKGKTYSIAEFDKLMENADNEWRENRKKEIEKYGSIEKALEDNHSQYQGYAKTKFTVNMPDGSSFSDRQDIGDGFGGVIDFLKKNGYDDIVPILLEDMKLDEVNKSEDITLFSYTNNEVENTTQQISDDVKSLAELFDSIYQKLYDGEDLSNAEKEVYSNAYKDFVSKNEDVLSQFVSYREDLISSDREVFAFVLALSEKGMINLEDYQEKPQVKEENYTTENFVIEENNDTTGAKTKFNNNINAIKTLKTCEAENRPATKDEQKAMSLYTGWGGLANAFDESKDKWSKEYTELKDILTDDEYKSARASTMNAFYTDNVIIDSIYKVLDNIGFKGGDVLEPACGIGNFIGREPLKFKNAINMYGVELDSVSGRIAQKLYPQANIQVTGFEKTNFQDNSFDVAIGNVPFGDITINDKQYNSQRLKIHDYFFIKALDKVREGGIVAFVTSTGTLDKKDSKFRKTLSEKADLLGAIRLPNNAFKTAGTEVTSDIIFLQKRSEPLDKYPEWVNLGKTENGLSINKYFEEHPKMILGQVIQGNKMFGSKDDTTVIPFEEKNLSELLDEAVSEISAIIPEVVNKPEPIKQVTANEIVPPENLRENSFFMKDNSVYYLKQENDGSMYVKHYNDVVNKAFQNTSKQDIVKDYIDIRDTVRELLEVQQKPNVDDLIKSLQDKLNQQYDKFYQKNGLINSHENLLKSDTSYYLVSTLEAEYDLKKNQLIKKADIFTTRTIKSASSLDNVDTPMEALAISMVEKGRVDLDFISSLCGINVENCIEALRGEIFPVPEISTEDNIQYQTSSEYLSGDIYKKLDFAKQAVEENPIFEANITALEKAKPERLKAGDIDVKIGATWIRPELYQQFLYETLKTPNDYREDVKSSWWSNKNNKIKVNYSSAINQWEVTNKRIDNGTLATKTYGMKNFSAYKVFENLLNLKESKVYKDLVDKYNRTVYDSNGDPIRVVDVTKTKVLKQKANKLNTAFKNWIFKDPERRKELVDLYNRSFNCIKPRQYDGSHLTFPAMSASVELYPHQKNAIAHALFGGNTLFAHGCGAGKTYEMIATAMESKRLGFCNKACICVPKNVVEQVGADFKKLYPMSNVLVAKTSDFSKANRQKFLSKIALGNYDCVIIGHTQLASMPLSPDREARMLNEQLSDIMNGIEELKKSDGSRFQIKALEREKNRIEQKLLQNKSIRRDNSLYFEDLGIDKLIVDEAHEFKNLYCFTKLSNVAGISNSSSQKSSDLFMKCRYLDELTDSKGVVFATGTPISNSITELHTMMRYLEYDFLVEHHNMQNFDNWISIFGKQETSYELAPTGNKFKERTRIAEYTNMPELLSMFNQVADICTTESLGLKLPECEQHIINVEATDLQHNLVVELDDRADKVQQGNVEPSEDNFLKITGDGRKTGLDPRLLSPELEDNAETKLNICVENVFKIFEETKEQKLTQCIFCDLGTPKGSFKSGEDGKESKNVMDSLEDSGAFCIYDDIKSKLIKKGVPANEIAYIHEAKNDKAKLEMFDKVRNGEIRVILGSTSKLGTGANIQDKLIACHDLDVPWRPSDLQQRLARMVRQGNDNEKVHLYRYVTKGTFDAYSYQILEKKQRPISQIMSMKCTSRKMCDVDQQALNYSEIKSLCTGDERIREKFELENRVSELKSLKDDYTNTKYELEDIINEYPEKKAGLQANISAINEDIETVKKNLVLGKEGKPEFRITINGKEYTDYEQGREAFKKVYELAKQPDNHYKQIEVGSVFGLKLTISNVSDDLVPDIKATVQGKGVHSTQINNVKDGANMSKIINCCLRLEDKLSAIESKLNVLDVNYEVAKSQYDQPFLQEQELKEKSERLEVLTDELKSEEMQRYSANKTKATTNYFGDIILKFKSKKADKPKQQDKPKAKERDTFDID